MVKKNKLEVVESGNPEDNGRREKGKQGKGYTKAPGKNETQDNTRKELLKIKIPTKSQQQDPHSDYRSFSAVCHV